MVKSNCWEIKNCGRELGGNRNSEFGICPAANDSSCDGINGGKNSGRICWAIAGTFCGGKVQGDFAQKSVSCMSCEVFKQIKSEEGPDSFILLKPGQIYHASAK
jgi:hypothetical protein